MATQFNMPFADLIKAADQIEQCRFAGTVGADDGVPFSAMNGQVDTVNDFAVAEALVDVNELKRLFCHDPESFF
jgi:hypothetical protein